MKDRRVGELVYYPCSTLTAGPLSAAAQRVMAALRAQYAARIDRKPHSESGLERNYSVWLFSIICIRDCNNIMACILLFGTCNKGLMFFEGNNSGQKRKGGETNDTPEKMQVWSFEEKPEITEERENDQNSEGEITKEFEIEEGSRSLEDQSYLKDMPLFHKENQKICIFSADCHDLAANRTLTNKSHLPVHHTSVSVITSNFIQHTEDKEQASEAKSAKVEHVSHRAEVYMHQFGMKNDQMKTQESSIKPKHSEAPKVTETHYDQPAFSQVGQSSGVECITPPAKQYGKWQPPQTSHGTPHITLQQEPCSNQTPSISGDTELQHVHQAQQNKGTMPFMCPLESTQNQEAVPVQTATLLEQCKKPTESKVEIYSDILKAAWQRCSALEGDEKIHLKRDRDVDKASDTTKQALALTSHPLVCDASCLSQEERICLLEEAARARALVVTMVYQDGTTQLDPEQKCPPAVCGVLVMMKKSLDTLVPEDTGAAEERLLFLRLEQRPIWAQQVPQHTQDLFTREILVKMVCGTQSLICYKSKDLLRTALRHFSKHLSWKQVANCQVLDPQIASWLLDPADSASCFQDLFNKYCTRPTLHTPAQAELRYKKASHVISSLSHLHRVMVELRNKLETQGLWQLYFCMEQKTIPILAAMESHRIHVDRDALKRTSEMLGNKIKHLEQEAHQTAGQKFLVSSSSQLRLVLFEKLRLHERCENKKLPKTMLKQQQSTSEAVLLQLQDLHPLPRIILEYRQVHKIKSTFLDGILSCMTKSFISSTWNQTSTVSGRLSAKHPNFQALPRQPVQISKKQRGEGKEAELVTVHPRAMFIPREGWTFLSADFCQVELRLLAHLSSDPELLRIFQNPETDVFNMLASQWKGVSEDRVSAEDREHVKRIVYSVVYGAGKERLSGILGVSAEDASRFQDSFLQKYKGVQAFIQCTVQHCHKYGYVKSIMGRRRSLPHIYSTDWSIRNQAERQAVNFVVQGSAADLCKMAMIHICSLVASSSTLSARLVAQIHDELLFEVEDTQVEYFAELVKNTMESLQHISCLGVSLTVPLKVSVSTGRSWGSMCEVGLPHAATTHQSD
ncbi:DNA polymerase nu [Clarias gariepinus]